MSQNGKGSILDQTNTQELQHLITVSTGFIDAYIIDCYEKAPMLLPQNIVISALDSPTQVKTVEWHDHKLPAFRVSDPNTALGVALVVEGESANERFALLCNEMPRSIRLRISEVVDEENQSKDETILYMVRVGDEKFHVPNLAKIQQTLGLTA
ncbi:hypothetical protein [Acinetobacter piscicola]|uniref:hypothetical protein n=1 Tax=Acinetobacter piscicola TaxID=2006115 RepID=UPI00101EA03C|nr:hypothetical protein [Acinetobacter piscicola]RYL26159.1 hypothetical protein EWP19_09345 [Acinetobacter piscicola]